ncbi:hypothetical protein B0H11DRAFT_1928518 [Mycena galericulata]|nr:hypothetical protein B0H11DRAFT_1928518 [Mycena galericulata]
MPPLLVPTDHSVASISAGETSRLRHRPAVILHASATDRITIYCGAESDPLISDDIFESEYDEHRPWIIQMLPEYTPPPPPRTKYPPSRSNGCGAAVHYAARALQRCQRWYGWKEDLESTVVPLDDIYFASETRKMLGLTNGEAECGCIISGIGCAICGNPLGARLIRCATHSAHAINPANRDGYMFLPTTVSTAASSNADLSATERQEPPTSPASLPPPDFPTLIAHPPPPNSIPFFPPSTSTSASASASGILPVLYTDPTPTPAARHPWSIPPTPTPTMLPPPAMPVLAPAPAPPITPATTRPGLQSAVTMPAAQQITTIPAPAPTAVSVEHYFSGGGTDAGAVGANSPSPSADADVNADIAGTAGAGGATEALLDSIFRRQERSTTPSWDTDALVTHATADLWGEGGGITPTARARVRDLDALGARVAVLDAAAADVQQHINSLCPAALALRASVRTHACSPLHSPSPAREIEVESGVWVEGVREEIQSQSAVLEATRSIDAVIAPPTNDAPHPDPRTALINSTRAAIAEERARLTSLTAPPPPALTVTSPPATADPLTTAPLLRDIIARARGWAGRGDGCTRPTVTAGGGGVSQESGSGSGSRSRGVASALACAHSMLEHADRVMRVPWTTYTPMLMHEWAAVREMSTWGEVMRLPSMAAAAEVQRSMGASNPPASANGDRSQVHGGEDDKRPRSRRCMFFDR